MDQNKGFRPTEQLNWAGAGLTILVILAFTFFVDPDSVKIWVEKAGVWGPLVFILLKISTIVVAPLSGSPLYPLVGLLFGFWPGILYIEIGDFLGYTIAFFLSRIFGKNFVAKFISDKEEGVLVRIMAHAGTPRGFFHACLTLFAIPELLCYGAGLTRLPYFNFITTIVPITAMGATLFVFIGSILDVGNQSLLIGFGLPALGILAMFIGGFLFTKGVLKKESSLPKL